MPTGRTWMPTSSVVSVVEYLDAIIRRFGQADLFETLRRNHLIGSKIPEINNINDGKVDLPLVVEAALG